MGKLEPGDLKHIPRTCSIESNIEKLNKWWDENSHKSLMTSEDITQMDCFESTPASIVLDKMNNSLDKFLKKYEDNN